MKKNKLAALVASALVAITAVSVFACVIDPSSNLFADDGSPVQTQSIIMNSTNSPELSTSAYGSATKIQRYTEISYTNAKNTTSFHVELNASGVIKNTQQIASIKSITSTFTVTSGTVVTLKTSYDKESYDTVNLSSGVTQNLESTLPYYFEISTNGVTKFSAITITYDCAPHDPIGTEATIEIGTSTKSADTAISATELKDMLTTESVTVSSTAVSTIFSRIAGVAGIRAGSGKYSGSITFNFASSILVKKVVLDVAQYNTDTTSLKVTSSVNTTGESITLTSSTTSLTYDCFSSDTTKSSSITISSAAKSQRFYLTKVTITTGYVAPVAVSGVKLNKLL